MRRRLVRLAATLAAVAPLTLLGVTAPQAATGATTVAARVWEPPTDLKRLDAALDNRRHQAVRLAFVGSSTTQGLGATDPASSYAHQVVTRLSLIKPTYRAPGSTTALGAPAMEVKGIEGFNGGRGGTWAGNYVPDGALQAIASTAPACVFHMIGSNDAVLGVTPANYEAALRKTIARIDAAVGSPVCHVLVHTFRRPSVSAATWAEFGAALRRIDASHPRAFAVDASKAFARRGVPGKDPFGLISADKVHPSDAGHALLARVVVSRVGKRLLLVP